MKKNIRSKIRGFLKSEEGRVGAKSPLTLGVASTGLLLAQTIATPSVHAHIECIPQDPGADCADGEVCKVWCDKWDLGTCSGTWHAHCEEP